MRTSDGYRFGLQFKDSSDLHHQVGELLERLGNSKSKLVVSAMIEYIQAHPEILDSGRACQDYRALWMFGRNTKRKNRGSGPKGYCIYEHYADSGTGADALFNTGRSCC